MGIEALKTLDGYLNYESSGNGTTMQEYQELVENQHGILKNIVDNGLWQPGTNYSAAVIIQSPSMLPNTVAKVISAGISGAVEPTWTGLGTTVIDNGITYSMVPKTTETATVVDIRAGTNAILAVTPKALMDFMDDVYKNAKLAAWPVGVIYESTDSTSPAILLGGTWLAMEAGRTLISAGTATSGTVYNAGALSGEESHKLTINEIPQHNHQASADEQGKHTHGITYTKNDSAAYHGNGSNVGHLGGNGEQWIWSDINTNESGLHSHTITINNTGGDGSHNNMPPYQVVFRWKRTA